MFLIKYLQNKQIQPKIFTYICLAVIALLFLLQLFMLSIVFPQQGGEMNLHIPSRSGGNDYKVDTSEFAVIGGVALSVAVLSTVLVAGLIRIGKSSAAVGVTLVLLFSSVTFIALYIGSAFSILWGDIAATIGVIGMIVAGMILELPLLVWLNQNFKQKQTS